MNYVLKATNLSKDYKKFKALNNLTMSIPKGSIYGLVGKNGAGKTTLIRLICGLQSPTAGDLELYETNWNDSSISEKRKKLGGIVETPSIYLDMTAEDNLKQQYYILGMSSFEGIKELLILVGLDQSGTKKAKNFSLGMRQRLGIAVALCGNPEFLVLDEPINGLDPQGIIEIRELILKLNRERNITVLISSHVLDELARIATNYGFLDKGQIIKEMSAEELENSCRKCIHLKVTDTKILGNVLDHMNIEYKIIDKESAYVYASPVFSQFSNALSKENCEVLSMTEHHETLENFFVSLVGGDS